jgi:hypothetical protein
VHVPSGDNLSRKFLDFNPDTGLLTTTSHEDGKSIIKYEQDCEPFWEENARFRANSAALWEKGKKDEARMTHVAFVPDVVIIDMMQKHGVNFYAKEDGAKVKHLIETEYSKCKTTDKRLWIPSSKKD